MFYSLDVYFYLAIISGLVFIFKLF